MPRIYHFFFALILVGILPACASKHKKLLSVPLGLTKLQSLQKFGEPDEKYRKLGADHWVYQTLRKAKNKGQGKILYRHVLVFTEGSLTNSFFTRSFTQSELEDFYSE